MCTYFAGFTALHLSIVKSRNEVAKLLISELGVKGMGAVNESGITAAHVAASAGVVCTEAIIERIIDSIYWVVQRENFSSCIFAFLQNTLATHKPFTPKI